MRIAKEASRTLVGSLVVYVAVAACGGSGGEPASSGSPTSSAAGALGAPNSAGTAANSGGARSTGAASSVGGSAPGGTVARSGGSSVAGAGRGPAGSAGLLAGLAGIMHPVKPAHAAGNAGQASTGGLAATGGATPATGGATPATGGAATCTCPEPPKVEDEVRDGSRLKVRWWTSPDGLRVPTGGFWDEKRGEACSPQAIGGETRCRPTSGANHSGFYFSDSACTQMVFVGSKSSACNTQYGSVIDTSGCPTSVVGQYSLEPYSGDVFQRTESGCSSIARNTGLAYYTGARIDDSEFATVVMSP